MKKILLIFMALAFCGINLSNGQASFLADDGVAVFYPAHFFCRFVAKVLEVQ